MPGIDGFEATRQIMETSPVPIIIISGIDNLAEIAASFRVMEAGALAVLPKPPNPLNSRFNSACKEIVSSIRTYVEVKVIKRRAISPSRRYVVEPVTFPSGFNPRLVVMGASTGGPPVIQTILRELPRNFPLPMVLVQHMSPGFIEGFAEWLSNSTGFTVKVPEANEQVRPGIMYVAPDSMQTGITADLRISLVQAPPEHSLRPSVSYLFRSAATNIGSCAIGVLLTGMGNDGASELLSLHLKGAVTIIQDQESSIVYGMPGEALKLGAAAYVLPPAEIAHELIEESTVVSIMYRFATLHAKKENYQIASDYFDQIYKIRPEESQVLYLAGEAYERMGNLETALERYTSAICEDPMDSLVWLVRGRVLLNMGEAEDALLSLKQATSLSDEWFDAWMLQGKIEIELGYLDEARKSLTYATVLIPDESESWRLLGDVLHNLKDINPSRIAYERALAIDFSDHEARRGKINAHLSAAEIEEALGEYDIALSLKGENFWDLYGKAMVLFDANRVQEGEIILERAEAFVSEDPKVLFCLAGGWGAICEFERAESFYAASCELDPENSKVWCLRGHSLRDAGKFDEAVVCFNRALEIDPEDSESHSGKEICMDILEGRTLPYTCQRPDHDKNINTNSDQQLKEME